MITPGKKISISSVINAATVRARNKIGENTINISVSRHVISEFFIILSRLDDESRDKIIEIALAAAKKKDVL